MDNIFGKHVFDLRKARGWSQPELAKLIGTSGAIIGRYERNEITPSIDVAKKLADAFGVTLDYLVGEDGRPNVLQDLVMLDRVQAINELAQDDRDRVLYVVDGLIRDARTRQAYGNPKQAA